VRFAVTHGSVRIVVSDDGIRSALGIVAFWVIAGMRMTFVSSGNRQGNWVFRIVHGRPPELRSALEQLRAARIWVMLWACTISLATWIALRTISPASLLSWPATAAQILVAAGMCLLLTDLLFLNVTTVAFTGEPTRDQPNLAFTVLKYYTAFPIVAAFPIFSEWWVEKSAEHMAMAALIVAAVHLLLRYQHGAILRQHCNLPELEDGEEDFPMKLGLRY